RATHYVALNLAVIVITNLESVDVEPGGDARGFQSRLDLLHSRQVLARIADEHRVIGHLARRRQEPRRHGADRGYALARRLPAAVQPFDETLSTHVDAGAHAHLLQECHQAVVLAAVVVRQYLTHIAWIGQTLALRHAQEQPRQPVSEVAADEQQMIV